LGKREVHIQKKIEAQVNEAKGHLAKKTPQARKAAMICMKRKKMYEAEVQKIQGAQMTLESQAMALESSAMNQQTIEAMKAGAKAMEASRAGIGDADDVAEVMDNIQEEMQVSDEISEQISQPVFGTEIDEDEFEAEMAALEEDMMIAETPEPLPAAPSLPEVPVMPVMPQVPTSAVAVGSADADEEAALRELEAAMMA